MGIVSMVSKDQLPSEECQNKQGKNATLLSSWVLTEVVIGNECISGWFRDDYANYSPFSSG